MFKHALTQDVAYDSLLRERRKDLHRQVGHAIEELYADRLPEQYEMLAHHFSKGEEWQQALDYLLKAAEKATQAFGLRQALELLGEAREVAERLGERVPVETLMKIHQARADLFFGIGEFVRSREEAETLLALTRQAGDRAAEAGALVQLASSLQWSESFPEAHARVEEAIELAERVGARGPLSGAHYVRGYLHGVSGELGLAEQDLNRSLDIARQERHPADQAHALYLLGLYQSWQGRYGESLTILEEAVRISSDHRLAIPLLRSVWTQGLAWNDTGQYDRALTALTEGLALAEKIGDDAFIPRYLNTIGWARIEGGDFAEGIAWSERSYEETARSSRAGHGTGAERRAFIRNNEGDALMAQGDLAAAANALEESLHTVTHPPPSRWMTWRYGTHCYASLAQLALLRGDPERARRLADDSLEIGTRTASRKFESWAWRVKGESATMRHAWGEAEEALQRALTIAESIHHPRQTWLSHLALGRLRAAQGRRDDARRSYQAAQVIVAGLRERTHDPGLRHGLTSTPLIRELEELSRS